MFENKLFQMNFFISFTIYLTFLINIGQKDSFINIETMHAIMLKKLIIYLFTLSEKNINAIFINKIIFRLEQHTL